jgi:hypothetical protein
MPSYVISTIFDNPIYVQSSHSSRENEHLLVNIMPRVSWIEWMKQLSTFKYAVHLMPTVAAGTFSLNCAYLGIPCIGNKDVDTQRVCHPNLSVKVSDIKGARDLALRLRDDEDFYNKCSEEAKVNYRTHYDLEVWKSQMKIKLNDTE